MRNRNKNISSKILTAISMVLLCGCAAGAATAGYAVKADSATRAVDAEHARKADSADSLTSDAEQKIVDRAKRETLNEINSKSNNK